MQLLIKEDEPIIAQAAEVTVRGGRDSLAENGLTIGEVQAHLAEIYGADVPASSDEVLLSGR